jgi:hypothetical protein
MVVREYRFTFMILAYRSRSNIQDPNDPNIPCPHSHLYTFHTNEMNDLGECALAVAYKSNASEVTLDDFAVSSVNQACIYYRFTDFQVPEQMPKCPNRKRICAWSWIHRARTWAPNRVGLSIRLWDGSSLLTSG